MKLKGIMDQTNKLPSIVSDNNSVTNYSISNASSKNIKKERLDVFRKASQDAVNLEGVMILQNKMQNDTIVLYWVNKVNIRSAPTSNGAT